MKARKMMYKDPDEDAVDQFIRALRHRDFRVEELIELLWATARDNRLFAFQGGVRSARVRG